MPKISIITINFNNILGLKKTIESVVSQTYKKIQYIIIDGNSTDGSKEFLHENSACFDYWVSEPDNGIYHAMNKGIFHAKGEYLLFLNSGDTLLNEFILESVSNKCLGDELIFFNFKNQMIKKETLSFLDFWFQTPYCHQAIFFKKTIFEEFGLYKENLRIVGDWEIILKSLYFNKKYKIFNEDIVNIDLNGISNTKDGQIIAQRERIQVLKNDYSFFYDDLKKLAYFKNSKVFRSVNKILLFVNKGVKFE
jgi:glycosyltransferase involved in cell wall biosynthesis